MARLRQEQATKHRHAQVNEEDVTASLDSPLIADIKYKNTKSPSKGSLTKSQNTDLTAGNIQIHGSAQESSKSRLKSPSKAQSRFVATGHTQRALKPMRENTLWFDSARLSPPRKVDLKPARSSPQRMAKSAVTYSAKDSPSSTFDSDDQASEWNCSTLSQDEESFGDQDSMDELPMTALRTPRRLKSRTITTDLTDSDSEIETNTKSLSTFTLSTVDSSSKPPIRTSHDIDSAAFLKFTPPQLIPLSKGAAAAKTRPVTPPEEPLSPTKSKLTSPKKEKRTCIPPTPHRQSIDAFWSQEVINTWNDEYSPRKTVRPSPKKLAFESLKPIPLLNLSPEGNSRDSQYTALKDPLPVEPVTLSPNTSLKASKQTITMDYAKAPAKTAAAERKAFNAIKHDLATSFLCELDTAITNGQVSKMTMTTEGVQIIWSNKLISTAGRANWRREAVRRLPNAGEDAATNESASTVTSAPVYRHTASIELSTKIITTTPRLLNVVAHEFCHLANFMVSGIKDQPHGASFKTWAAKVSALFSSRGVTVTTKHDYSVEFKYVWVCQGEGCGEEYARHSKSIDVERMRCGRCRGRLRQIRPVPRGVQAGRKYETVDNGGDPGKTSVKKSDYQVFVSRHFRTVKDELGPKSPMKDVMKELGSRYREQKGSKAETAKKVTGMIEEEHFGGVPDEEGVDDRVKSNGEKDVDSVARMLDFLAVNDD